MKLPNTGIQVLRTPCGRLLRLQGFVCVDYHWCQSPECQLWSVSVVESDGLGDCWTYDIASREPVLQTELFFDRPVHPFSQRVLVRVTVLRYAHAYCALVSELDILSAAILVVPIRVVVQLFECGKARSKRPLEGLTAVLSIQVEEYDPSAQSRVCDSRSTAIMEQPHGSRLPLSSSGPSTLVYSCVVQDIPHPNRYTSPTRSS